MLSLSAAARIDRLPADSAQALVVALPEVGSSRQVHRHFNHQHFVSAAQQALRHAEKSSRSACVVLIDLDHFKRVNDP